MDIVREINEKLDEIEEKENVRILYAVESGSRAWGFESPDSDYDVRFIYARKLNDYLRLDEVRDVIEWQLDDVYDINGWDLKKALKLFRKGNASLFEWLSSPIVYRSTPEMDKIREVSKLYFSERSMIHHYNGVAGRNNGRYLQGKTAQYKKYFYALRPLLASRYIETYHTAPPVPFAELLKLDLPQELLTAIDQLVEMKKQMTEAEKKPQIPVIKEFITTELSRQKKIERTIPDDQYRDWEPLNQVFYETILS